MRRGGLIALAIVCSQLLPVAAQSNSHLETGALEGHDILYQTIDDERLDHALESYLADKNLQTERPVWTPEPQEIKLREPREPGGGARGFASFMNAIAGLIGYLLLFALAVAIALAVYFMFGESLSLRRRQKTRKQSPALSEIPNLQPEEAAARALLEDADALAAAGRFAEAVHLLLFRSINEIQDRQQGRVSRALTAREIGNLSALPTRIRQALAPIIKIVERSFFGEQGVDADSWKSARASYQDFAFGEAWT